MSIYNLGSKILTLLEILHDSGYVHNDISLTKLVLCPGQTLNYDPYHPTASPDNNIMQGKDVQFLNYTYATPYVDFGSGSHLAVERV